MNKINEKINRCDLVRKSAAQIMKNSVHVKINQEKINQNCKQIDKEIKKYKEFNEFECHFQQYENNEQIISYIFILDCLNFCFWPSLKEFEYENLAKNLKILIQKQENKTFKAENILKWDKEFITVNIFENQQDFPLLEERLNILHDVAKVILNKFEGKFENIYLQCNKSAVEMLNILVSNFSNFEDHIEEKKLYFYKRSQILIADLYAQFKIKNVILFDDIQELTTFPDYRVPQILLQDGILQYSNELMKIIENKETIPSGDQMEIEIRMATVMAVELIKKQLQNYLTSIEIDWILWQKGELNKDNIIPHHRTISIYY